MLFQAVLDKDGATVHAKSAFIYPYARISQEILKENNNIFLISCRTNVRSHLLILNKGKVHIRICESNSYQAKSFHFFSAPSSV